MKVKPVGEEVYFEAVEEGGIFLCEGAFYYKIYTCVNINNYGMEYNCVDIETGDFYYIDANKKVVFYPKATVTLV